jgi:hypothetical protein
MPAETMLPAGAPSPLRRRIDAAADFNRHAAEVGDVFVGRFEAIGV